MDHSHLVPEVPSYHGPDDKFATNRRGTVSSERLDVVSVNQKQSRGYRARKLVLCFDGTGNKFHGNESDSNILKIFRMLDRTADDQYHYYQPGIGTYVDTDNLSHTSLRERVRSWYLKAKDSAVGSSFDSHVIGGYRFLMRFYSPGDEIYIFGFSRGSYIARFLAEMIDHVGLLSHGNEEMIFFAWKTFSQWQCREATDASPESKARKQEMFSFMKGFRETFSRPVRRIRFLGLFDTVNSVPRFETAWMQRSKFPYTARSSALTIRHAVSIDERRAKFRQDLIYQQLHRKKSSHSRQGPGHYLHMLDEKLHQHLPHRSPEGRRSSELKAKEIVEDNSRRQCSPDTKAPDTAHEEYRDRRRSPNKAAEAAFEEYRDRRRSSNKTADTAQQEYRDRRRPSKAAEAAQPDSREKRRPSLNKGLEAMSLEYRERRRSSMARTLEPMPEEYQGRRHSSVAKTLDMGHVEMRGRRGGPSLDVTHEVDDEGVEENYRYRSRSRSRETRDQGVSPHQVMNARRRRHTDPVSPMGDAASAMSYGFFSDAAYDSDEEEEQDIDEVWFAGGHGDVGGGWEVDHGVHNASHVPLTWMVREAMRAGLTFDMDKVHAMGCSDPVTLNPVAAETNLSLAKDGAGKQLPTNEGNDNSAPKATTVGPNPIITVQSPSTPPLANGGSSASDHTFFAKAGIDGKDHVPAPESPFTPGTFHDSIHKAHLSRIHDSLMYDCGMSKISVLSWRLMEYLPFRRMDLQADGSWKPIRWPLPFGEVRDIPHDARVHGSVIRRMSIDASYRPGNLIIGGGGRGCRVAPPEYGIGEWVCIAERGDLIGEIWMKKSAVEKMWD